MTADPRIIPPGKTLPPMDLGERPAHRNDRDAGIQPKRKPGSVAGLCVGGSHY